LADFPCAIVPTKTIPQAFAALFAIDQEASLETNVEEMTEAIAEVKTGEVTTAIKESRDVHGNPIVAGDVIGIADGSLEVVGATVDEVVLGLLKVLEAEDADACTILGGEDFSQDDMDQLVSKIELAYEDLEIDAHHGGQPLYPVIFSVE
ncbi:MAG: DAK2 domain-containing protein, partial [Eggerthellaceae bacterium]|nr:DAK2 domain-containing protein [Eggerthellaceae bacterium]